MKIVEFVLTSLVMVLVVSAAFGCALAIATVWLRALVRAITRNSYNVSDVPNQAAEPLP